MGSQFTASVLVRNVQLFPTYVANQFVTTIRQEIVDFGEFTIREIDWRGLPDAQKLFPSDDACIGDYLLEKTYPTPPSVPHLSPHNVGGIPEDIEDVLLLLRLFRPGEVAFVKLAITKPDGNVVRQFPYRMINALNSYSDPTELRETARDEWRSFADELRSSQSWPAPWFSVARRFFLYGGSKEFNPRNREVDRIVDYVTALEAALIPEKGFLGKRLRNRAAALLSADTAQQTAAADLVKELYNVRSEIVHGSVQSKKTIDWLQSNRTRIEQLVRGVLVAAVKQVPAHDPSRTAFLTSLFDINDDDRMNSVIQQFYEIKTDAARDECAAKVKRGAKKKAASKSAQTKKAVKKVVVKKTAVKKKTTKKPAPVKKAAAKKATAKTTSTAPVT
jgi:hypothetical protein